MFAATFPPSLEAHVYDGIPLRQMAEISEEITKEYVDSRRHRGILDVSAGLGFTETLLLLMVSGNDLRFLPCRYEVYRFCRILITQNLSQ